VLVCGASGFIGRNVAERLAGRPDLEVRGTYCTSQPWSHPRVALRRADLRDAADVRACLEGVDLVVQAAATTSGAGDIAARPWIHVTDNAVMNSLVFRQAHEAGVAHLIFFSCSLMYPSRDEPAREEDCDLNAPVYPRYFGAAWTKLYLEKMCEFYASLGRTRFTVIRHSNVYGPHDKYDLERSHVFGASVAKVMAAADGRVVVWGEGREARDLLYVSDLVDLVERALDGAGEPFALYNAGAGEMVAVRDLVARIVAASGRDLALEFDRLRPSFATRVRLDSSRARERLGWEPKVSLDEGIRRTLAWYRARA
jgi:nucleoside-diphosphate-sugar epimerase